MSDDGSWKPTPCLGNQGVYDVLQTYKSGRPFQQARLVARELCGKCHDSCLQQNKDQKWARVVLGAPAFTPAEMERRSSASVGQHAKRRAERVAQLEDLIASGADIARAVEVLGTNQEAIRVWCRRHGHTDLYLKLAPAPEPAPLRYPRRKSRAKSVAA